MRAVVNGKYIQVSQVDSLASNSQYKAWNLDDQRSVHAADILQAHKGGKPNPAFVRQYPEEAKRFFNQNQIIEASNTYE